MTKTTVFVGGRLARRTPEAWERRNANAPVRAEKNGHSPITRGRAYPMGQGKGKGKGKGKDKGKGKVRLREREGVASNPR